MKHYSIDRKLEAIELYEKGKSIKELSERLSLNYITVWRWIKRYEEKGIRGIKRKNSNEESLVLKYICEFKQRNPGATIKEIQKGLKRDIGISFSLKKIWKILKEHGFTGFDKDSRGLFFNGYIPLTEKVREDIRIAESLFKNGKIKQCAEILNSLPFCPENQVLTKIPDRYLNLKRKLDKLCSLYGKIPYDKLAKRAEFLRKEALKSSKIYTSIRAGIFEIKCLEWTYDAEKIIKVGREIEKEIGKNLNEKKILFHLFVGMGKAYAILHDYKKAIEYANKSERIIKNLKNTENYWVYIAGLYTFMEDNRRAWRCVRNLRGKDVFYYTPLIVYTISGDFKQVDRLIRSVKRIEEMGVHSGIYLSKAIKFLAMGRLKKAEYYAKEALLRAKKSEITGYIYSSNIIFAAIYSAMGMRKEKEKILEKTLKFVKKQKLIHYENLLKPILDKKYPECIEKERFPRRVLYCLLIKASLTLNKGDITRLFYFAKKEKMLGILYRDILLFPEIIEKTMQYKINIPFNRKFLQLPCFNKDIPAFHVKFLGPLKIYRNGNLLKVHLSPTESSFLIFLANMQEKKYPKQKVIQNYWGGKKYGERYFYNLIFHIRKKLGIPSHLLYLKKNYLYNEVNFHTDWDEFQNHIANAHALLRIGEKNFAKKAFLNAFKLIRGKPFEKMYDRWSEDRRTEILLILKRKLENYFENFGISEKMENLLDTIR